MPQSQRAAANGPIAVPNAFDRPHTFLLSFSSLAFVTVSAQALFFVAQILVANMLGAIQFGYLSYGMAIGNYGQTAVRFGMDRTMTRELVQRPGETSELIGGSYLLRC